MPHPIRAAVAVCLATLAVAPALASPGHDPDDSGRGGSRDFSVQFGGCTEYVGTGPLPLARAQAFVKAPYAAVDDGQGQATLVVRAAQCRAVAVDGGRALPGTVAHIGVVIAPPDGTGTINNFTVAYATSSARLAQRLERAGLPVLLDGDLVYEVSPNPPVGTSELYVEVSPERGAGWSVLGSVSASALFSTPFLANWWASTPQGRLKMATDIPLITFKPAQSTVSTRRATPLGQLLQANGYSSFGARAIDFNVRGEFDTGTMTVTVR